MLWGIGIDGDGADQAQRGRTQGHDLATDQVQAFVEFLAEQDVTLAFGGTADLLIGIVGDPGRQRHGVADADLFRLFGGAGGVADLSGVMDDQPRLRPLPSRVSRAQ